MVADRSRARQRLAALGMGYSEAAEALGMSPNDVGCLLSDDKLEKLCKGILKLYKERSR